MPHLSPACPDAAVEIPLSSLFPGHRSQFPARELVETNRTYSSQSVTIRFNIVTDKSRSVTVFRNPVRPDGQRTPGVAHSRAGTLDWLDLDQLARNLGHPRGVRWDLRGEERTRATFAGEHVDDYPGAAA